jgi:hypothetical protein
VLIIDPIQNTTDVTTLGGQGVALAGSQKWSGIAFSTASQKLYITPQ